MPADQTGTKPPLRILLAEDEAVTRLAARALLERAGHRVVTAEDGPAAVSAAAADVFDLVLMDLELPGLPGDEAVRAIRLQLNGAAPRILMLTASATADGQTRCAGCGADGVLTKPLRLESLAAALESGPQAASSPAEPPSAGPAFDEAAIATMREMLPATRVAELIDKAGAALRQHGDALEEALRTGDRRTAATMAHRIAGVSGQYGCLALRRTARALEAGLEDSACADLPQRIGASNAALAPALEFLERCAATARG
ncbi:regulator [Azospirillum thiophilum]|uniref:Regulator n=1 Tax=Azospirillum thiophilum TaxID=528244 RepID=A0AAC8ZSW5_9PROT|nr:regulator [Azospirillum thiophilum]KJR66606.1 regulator [Azospirillum thiophilum]